MSVSILITLVLSAMFTTTVLAQTSAAGGRSGPPLPEGAGKDVTLKVCGSTCHGPDIVMGKGRTRDQWTAVVNTMVSKGAKASAAELTQISEYLSAHFAPNMVVSAPPRRGGRSGGAPGASGRGPGPL